MRLLLAGSASCLPILITAATVPLSNSISPSQFLNASDLSLQLTGHDDPSGHLNLTGSNASTVGSLSKDGWHADIEIMGKAICITAVLVDAAHALARMAIDDLHGPETFIVKNYNEVQIKVTPFDAEFTRNRAATGLYAAVVQMTEWKHSVAARFTFFKDKERMGRIDFMGTPCSSGSRETNLANPSLPLVIPAEDSSLVATRSNAGSSRSAATALVNANDLADDSGMELDCQWHGQSIPPKIALLAPLSALSQSHIVNEDPLSHPALREVVDEQMLCMTIVLLATPQTSPAAPLWSYYWAIQALGEMPEKMADQFDWREMTMTVKVDGYQLATIYLIKGVLQTIPGPSLTGSNNGSILVT